MTMSKRIIAVVSEKGGTGKSLWASSYVDHARNGLGLRVAAYDGDGSVGALAAVHGQRDGMGDVADRQTATEGVISYDIRHGAERATFLDSIDSGHDIIIHDLAGGCLSDLAGIVGEGDDGDIQGLTAAITGAGYRLSLVHLVSNLAAAADSVGRYVAAFGTGADHVAVLNKHFGTSADDFPFWAGGSARAALLAAGGVEIDMPALNRRTFAKVEALSLPLSRVLASRSLGLTERTHVNAYRQAFAASVTGIGNLLGLPAAADVAA